MGTLMSVVLIVLIVLSAAGLGMHIVVLVTAVPFLLKRDPYRDVQGFSPPVSILKPVRGLAVGDEENFRSFFHIEYPRYEILFLVHRDAGDDPAIPCIERLIAEHPKVDARIIRATERTAVHEKVNNYIEGIREAAYGVICITDADSYVDRAYLSRDVRPLSDPRVGLVTSFQTMNGFLCAATAFEGLPQNFDGLAYFMGLDTLGLVNTVYGHSLLFRKSDFARVNAIDEIKDHILDDIAIGTAFCSKAGLKVAFSRTIIPTRYTYSSWKKVTGHVVRWKRFQRAKSPFIWALGFYYDLLWGIATIALSLIVPPQASLAGVPLRSLGLWAGGVCAAVRVLCVLAFNLAYGDCMRDLRYLWTLALYDPFAVFACIVSYFVNVFEHAGRTYRVVGDRMKQVIE